MLSVSLFVYVQPNVKMNFAVGEIGSLDFKRIFLALVEFGLAAADNNVFVGLASGLTQTSPTFSCSP